MFDLDAMTPEERFQFGGWLYYVSEGYKDPDWWEKNRSLAKVTGHAMNVNITAP